MSLGRNPATLEKRKTFAKRRNPASASQEKPATFLTIEKALPAQENKRLLRRATSASGFPRGKHVFGPESIVLGACGARAEKDKLKNPDRLCLDRRGLSTLPALRDEDSLRLLSLQHNLINSLEGFRDQQFPHLVFLDMYDNQLEMIQCLDELQSIRVLLLGKNRIKQLQGLDNLASLEVLDLHGNQIKRMEGLCNLKKLKVLNLAGNQIESIELNQLRGLQELEEFNLKRNQLKRLNGFEDTPKLQKVFLNNNDLHGLEEIRGLTKATQIREICIENNPISLAGYCVSFLVSYLSHLELLNNMRVTAEVRKAAMLWRRNKEAPNTTLVNTNKREEVISNARTNWELIRSQTKYLTASNASVKPVNSDNPIHVSKFAKWKSKPPLLPNKKFVLHRTQSQDTEQSLNTTTSSSNTISSGECFRLPPILIPYINKVEGKSVNLKRTESVSSVGPNVDSSISSLLSNGSDFSSSSSSDNSDNESETREKCEEVQGIEEERKEEPKIDCESKPDNEKDPIVDQQPPVIEDAPVEPSENVGQIVENNEVVASNPTTETSSLSATSSNISVQRNPRSSRPRLYKSNSYCRETKSATAKICTQKPRARSLTAKPRKLSASTAISQIDKDREEGSDYLIEICGRHLNVIGHGALRFLEKAWSAAKAQDVTIVNFQRAHFNRIASTLSRLKQRFPSADSFVFKETQIEFLGQLNAIAEVQGISSLFIYEEGNPIVQKNWESYAIYRLAHWGLRFVNGREISEVDIKSANEEYQSLGDVVLWTLPDYLLQPLLVRLQIGVGQKIKEKSAKKWLLSADPALRNVVIKEALQWKRNGATQEDLAERQKAKADIGHMLSETCNAVQKLRTLDEQWPTILKEIVHDILIEFSDMDTYRKKRLEKLN